MVAGTCIAMVSAYLTQFGAYIFERNTLDGYTSDPLAASLPNRCKHCGSRHLRGPLSRPRGRDWQDCTGYRNRASGDQPRILMPRRVRSLYSQSSEKSTTAKPPTMIRNHLVPIVSPFMVGAASSRLAAARSPHWNVRWNVRSIRYSLRAKYRTSTPWG